MDINNDKCADLESDQPLDDCIDGLNEKLLELLKNPPTNIKTHQKLATPTDYLKIDNEKNEDKNDADNESNACPANMLCQFKQGVVKTGTIALKHLSQYLTPIGVFWDIENCPVARGKSAATVAQTIRGRFFKGYKEAEFIVVCDVYKESKLIIQELNDAQVNLIHVGSTYKNAADEKLKQSIRRFADIHGSPSAILLISSDVNFAADLSDLRHRKKIHIILLHNNSSPALRLCANEVYSFNKLMEPLSWRGPSKTSEINDLIVTNLPKERTLGEIKKRLKRLSENCGGRIISIDHDSAIIRFGLSDLAERVKSSYGAQKRMDGETVFDRKITVKSFKERDNRKAKESVSALDLTTEASMPTGSPLQMYSAHSAIGVRSLPGTPQYNSSPPVVAGSGSLGGVPPSGPNNSYSGNQHCRMMQPAGPMYLNRSFANNIDSTYHRSLPELQRGHPQVVWPVAGMQYGRSWEESKVDRQQKYSRRVLPPQRTDPSHFQIPPTTPDGMRRIRGAHSTLNHAAPEWNMPRAAGYCPPPPAASSAFTTANFTQNTFKRRSSSPLYANQGRDGGQWNGQGQHVQPMRNARTPSPYGSAGLHPTNQQLCRTSPYTHSESDSDEVEKFFNPITTRSTCPTANNPVTPIELQVTNLDQNIEPKEMRRILSCIFMEHVQVIHVSVFMQSDGNFAASIKVPSLQEAQYAISQLHRRKIGYKRILIAYAHTGGPNPQLVRSQIVMLLQEVPGHKLPLFKFREMYESRFMISISVSELYKMKDVCLVTEDPNGRMVSLNPDHRNTPSPCITNTSQDTPLDLPFCTIHMQKPVSDKGWAEQEMAALPNVMITLSFLENAMNSLLACHGGSMPLPGLPTCWQEVFGEVMNIEEEGVPLEHLVSCLPSIELRQGNGSVKYLVWVGRKTPTENHEEIKCVSPPLANQLALFSRELVDLLKTAPHCQLPFNRFIPAYHHHFGRQCRVADYGFTKLIDLLEALTTTVQVMGEGNKRVVTLSHRAQVRRFTSDLLRVLKAQASKQIKLSEFPNVYTRVIGKQWDIVDYGLCHIDDILKEVSENTVVVTECGFNDKLISIPKREQTPEEIERTKQFAVEVVELLRHAPQCSMLFNKFVPSYHHHFGHQCRVSDYGFTKLIELFEAIPHVVNIEDTVSGERRISLTEKEGLRVLGEQVAKLVVKNRGRIAVGSIGQAFLHHYGYMLRPEMFKCSSMVELMRKLDDVLEIIENANGTFVQTFDRSYLLQLRLQCRRILMDQPQHEMPVKEFQKIYNEYYGSACNLKELKEELFGSVEFSGNVDHEVIQLTPLQSLACNLYKLLMKHNGKLALQKLEPFYQKTYGNSLCAAQYGFSTLTALLQSLACTLVLRETRNKKKNIYLNAKLALVGIPLPPTWSSPNNDKNSSTESLLDESAKVENPEISVSDQYLGKDAWTDKTSNNFWRKDSWGNSETGGLNWPILESTSEDFFKNLTTPIVKNHAKPPKPDTPPDDDDDEVVATVPNDGWKSSLWDTPPNFSQDVSSVEVPQIHLPNWSRIEDEETVSSLLSPTKSLLPAAANPLDLKTSPYYATKHLVIAPHPSELPLPSSLSIAPRRGLHSNDEALDSRLLGNSIEVHSPTNSENCSISESEASDLLNATPSKKIFGGKRRLAAQFNQPMD